MQEYVCHPEKRCILSAAPEATKAPSSLRLHIQAVFAKATSHSLHHRQFAGQSSSVYNDVVI